MPEAHATEFHRQEHSTPRTEILQRTGDMTNTEREVAIGLFVIYTWVLTHKLDSTLNVVTLWLPVVLAVSGMVKIEANRERIGQIGQYLKILEHYLADPSAVALGAHFGQSAEP